MADDISPAEYAVLRTYLEVAEVRAKAGWPAQTGYPSDAELVGAFVKTLPALEFEGWLTNAELEQQQAWYAKKGNNAVGLSLAPQLRKPEVVFRDPAQLRAAVDKWAPTTAAAVKALPGSESGGITWWVGALAIGGALYYIGKLNWKGALVSAIAARALLALAAYLAYEPATQAGKDILQGVKDAAEAAAAGAGSFFSTIGIAAVLVTVGVALVGAMGEQPTTTRRTKPSDPDADVGIEPGALPEPGAELLVKVYEQKRAEGDSKARAAKQAWGAVKAAGWAKYKAADGGEWWTRGEQGKLLLETVLQLEQRRGWPADEAVNEWASAAGISHAQLLDAVTGVATLGARDIGRLRDAAQRIAENA